jgi:hypothetical protein
MPRSSPYGYVLHDGLTKQERLESLTWRGAAQRCPKGLPDNVDTQIRHERRTGGRKVQIPVAAPMAGVLFRNARKNLLYPLPQANCIDKVHPELRVLCHGEVHCGFRKSGGRNQNAAGGCVSPDDSI